MSSTKGMKWIGSLFTCLKASTKPLRAELADGQGGKPFTAETEYSNCALDESEILRDIQASRCGILVLARAQGHPSDSVALVTWNTHAAALFGILQTAGATGGTPENTEQVLSLLELTVPVVVHAVNEQLASIATGSQVDTASFDFENQQVSYVCPLATALSDVVCNREFDDASSRICASTASPQPRRWKRVHIQPAVLTAMPMPADTRSSSTRWRCTLLGQSGSGARAGTSRPQTARTPLMEHAAANTPQTLPAAVVVFELTDWVDTRHPPSTVRRVPSTSKAVIMERALCRNSSGAIDIAAASTSSSFAISNGGRGARNSSDGWHRKASDPPAAAAPVAGPDAGPTRWDPPGGGSIKRLTHGKLEAAVPRLSAVASAASDGGNDDSVAKLRESMVLSGLTSIVTAVSAQGREVLYQNAASVMYYGQRLYASYTSHVARSEAQSGERRAGRPNLVSSKDDVDGGGQDLLAQLFSWEPAKLSRLVAEVCVEGRVWKGLIRVPHSCHVAATEVTNDASPVLKPPTTKSNIHMEILPAVRGDAPAVHTLQPPPEVAPSGLNVQQGGQAYEWMHEGTSSCAKSRATFVHTEARLSAAATAAGQTGLVRTGTLGGTPQREGSLQRTPSCSAAQALSTMDVREPLQAHTIDPLATSTWGLLMDPNTADPLLRPQQQEGCRGALEVPEVDTSATMTIPEEDPLSPAVDAALLPPLRELSPGRRTSELQASKSALLPMTRFAPGDVDRLPSSHHLAPPLTPAANIRRSADMSMGNRKAQELQLLRRGSGRDNVTDAAHQQGEDGARPGGLVVERSSMSLTAYPPGMLLPHDGGGIARYGLAGGGAGGDGGASLRRLPLRRCNTRADVEQLSVCRSSVSVSRVVVFASTLRCPTSVQRILQQRAAVTTGSLGSASAPGIAEGESEPRDAAAGEASDNGRAHGRGDELVTPVSGTFSSGRTDLLSGTPRRSLSMSQEPTGGLRQTPTCLERQGGRAGGPGRLLVYGTSPAPATTTVLSPGAHTGGGGESWSRRVSRRLLPGPVEARLDRTLSISGSQGLPEVGSPREPSDISVKACSRNRRNSIIPHAPPQPAARSEGVRAPGGHPRRGSCLALAPGAWEQVNGSGTQAGPGPCGSAGLPRLGTCDSARAAGSFPSAGENLRGGNMRSGASGVVRDEAAVGYPMDAADAATRPSPPRLFCWHEVTASPTVDPVTGKDVVIIVQVDVSAKVEAERHLALVSEAEHRLLEQVFPRHVLATLTEEGAPWGPAADATASCTSTAATAVAANGNGIATASMVRDVNRLATWHPQVTLLFADVEGFTPMCKQLQPQVVMAFLNNLFTCFDRRLDEFGVYKVETIGDCYVVAGGLIHEDEQGMPAVRARDSCEDPLHAEKVLMFAKAMLAAASQVLLPTTAEPVRMRIGIHSGPVVSGVVGERMPRFCLFGDTVNTASRMESTGVAGCIHASEAAYQLLRNEMWTPTGGIEVKGKGLMNTYLWAPLDTYSQAILSGYVSPFNRTSQPTPNPPLPLNMEEMTK